MSWLGKWKTESESGSVLIAVIGIMAVLSILAVGAYTIADDNLFQAERNRESAIALHVAEAGMDAVQWKIRKLGSNIEPLYVVETDNGEATVTITDVGYYQYKVTSVGHTNRNPSVRRTLTSTIFYVSLWNFVMGTGSLAAGGGGGALHGNTSVKGPFFIRGDLPLSGTTKLTDGPLFVKKGNITMQGSASIGTPSSYMDVFADGTYPTPGTNEFYANTSSNVPDLHLPPLGVSQLNDNYNTAKVESLDGMGGTNGSRGPNDELRADPDAGLAGLTLPNYYKIVDSDGAVGGGERDLVLSPALPAFGTEEDDLAWDPGTGLLVVRGTVFVDGDLYINQDVRYRGNGTIVITGNAYINAKMLAAGVYPTEDAVGVVTPNKIIVTVNGGNNPAPTYTDAVVAGAWYAGQEIRFDNNIVVRGSMLTSILTFNGNNNHLLTDPQLPAHLPPSMPGGTDLMVFPTRWHEGKN